MRNISSPKVSLGSFILGLVVAIMIFHAYTVYQIRALALQNQANIAQVANVLSQALNPQPAQQAPVQQVPAQEQPAQEQPAQ